MIVATRAGSGAGMAVLNIAHLVVASPLPDVTLSHNITGGHSMRGTVVDIHHERGMAGVLTEDGDYSVFELLGSDQVEVEDEVSWKDATSRGDTLLFNHTQGERYIVYSWARRIIAKFSYDNS